MFSLLDGLSKPEQIAERCKEIGASACALTDHGNIAGTIKFYTAMKKAGLKPILGCELYICSQNPKIKEKDNKKLSHFLVLAKNYSGWRNLIKIVSSSNNPEYYYHKPRLDLPTLKDLHSGDLIGITGHLGSTLADQILDGDALRDDWQNIGVQHISYLKTIFGDHLFLEAQLIDKDNLPIQEILTNCIRKLGQLTNTKVICTPDAHYCRKEDA